jgi:hypothetical protein
MSRWFRLDDDVINDPKILLLPEQMRWIWVAFLCVASKNSGQLPGIKIIALSLRVKETKAAEYLTRLCIAGLIDKTETGFAPHNWAKRQFKSDVSTDRVKRFRKQERNVSETPPHTHTHTHTETQTKKDPPAAAVDDWPENYGDLFWEAYPRKEEKISAMKKLATIRKSGIVTFADLIAGVKRYCAQQREPQFTKQPTAWLNKGCWADEHQTGTTNGQRTGNTRASGHDAILAAFTRKAREIVGDSPMAGPEHETEFPWGNGTQSRPADGTGGPTSGFAAPNERRASSAGSVLEGEIIPPDQPTSGIPGSRH